MQFGVRRVAALVALVVAASIADAAALGKQCYSNSDCGDGSYCVAGDSQTSVQRCVAGTPCGGKIVGACPGDESSGQLACIWRPDDEACSKNPYGCVELDNKLGIYKCISIDRCDQYFGDKQCSGSCNVNGKQCNGRGTCQLAGGTPSKPKFDCACDSGWNGTRCDGVVDDSCVVDVGQCGDHGTCVKNACTCKDGYTGVQCQVPPKSSSSGSGSVSTKTPTPTPSTTSSPNSSASKANSGDVVTNKKKGPSALVIIIAVLVALIVVGAIVFVVLARKRRRQQEAADNSGFNRTDSVLAGGEARTGPPTPKQKIVIM